NCLADVGTDHGYVPIYLYEKKVIPAAIAMDVNQGPLERAKLHIAEAKLEKVIETRLSDGLSALKPGEADSILIAGMGGPLIVKILDTHRETAASAKELILQPQSEIADVRKYLYEQGYEIIEEHIVLEDGKYYPMMKAVKNPQAEKLQSWEYAYGRLSVLEETGVLKAFVERELAQKQEIFERLRKKDTEKSRVRAAEMECLCSELQKMLVRIVRAETEQEIQEKGQVEI
ncbi:MAG: tRNA (adenine(22)-N(1))-methyltransferase, partial [Lachnospiraceae bacterium]